MTVIAMTREMGSRGREVALGLADRLGLEIIHHELVEQSLAARLNLTESAVHHFLEGQVSLFERWKIDRSRLSLYTQVEILELASRGNVLIRGWGAAQLLRSIGNVLCIRVCAPMRCRQDEILARVSLKDRDEARAEIERNDAAHAKVIQRLFKADWREPEHYDMVLNTERVPIDVCVDQIAQLADLPKFQQTERARRALTDKLIEFRIRGRLDSLSDNDGLAWGLQLSVDSGKVSLGGTAADDEIAHMIVRTAEQTEGVVEVDSRMRIASAAANNPSSSFAPDRIYGKHQT
jgi:cytidylate kinase